MSLRTHPAPASPASRRTILVVLLLLLRAANGHGAVVCPGDPGCCTQDTACDDGDPCTVDRCAPDRCEHTPIDVQTVRTELGGIPAVAECATEPLPPAVGRALHRAGTLLDRGARHDGGAATWPFTLAVARLGTARSHLATANHGGRISPACAAAIASRIDATRAGASCLVSEAASHEPFACLAGPGPLVRLTGAHGASFSRRTLATGTRLDARHAVFFASPSNRYPITLDGGANVCLAGGDVRGRYDRSLGWAAMHDMNNAAVAFANPTTVDGIRIDDVTDGIRPRGNGPFTIRNSWLSYVRDDCVENDHLEPGLIEDSLLDGCYVALSERPSPDADVDGRNDLVTIRRSLLRLEAMPGPRDGAPSELGHGAFFKWSDRGTQLALYDDVFLAERVAESGPETMGVPDSLAGCARNVMVWLGPGDYPAPLPACFTVTHDRAVWDDAVARWKADHPALDRS